MSKKSSKAKYPAHIPVSQRTWRTKVVDNTVGLATGSNMLPFQNLDKMQSTLDKFNKFYRVTCNPIHQLHCEKFYRDLEKIYKKDLEEGRTHRPQQEDQFEEIHLNSITEYYESNKSGYINIMLMSTKIQLSDKFIQLLKTDGIFFTSKKTEGTKILIEHVNSISNSNSVVSPTFNEPVRLASRELLSGTISQTKILDRQLLPPPPQTSNKYMLDDYILEEGSSNELQDSPSFQNRFQEEDMIKTTTPSQEVGCVEARKSIKMRYEKQIIINRKEELKQELNIVIPDSALSRQFLLSTPDSYYTFKGSLIPRAGVPCQQDSFLDEDEDDIVLDLFSLKILGLIVCKDKVDIKEGLFIDLVRNGEYTIDVDSVRLKRAVKKLLYFSEIMPKKYYAELQVDARDKGNRMQAVLDNVGQFTSNINLKPWASSSQDKPELWTEEYVQEMESFFHNNFDNVYATDFIPILFPKNQKEMTRKAFLKNLQKINLITDPYKLSHILQEDLEDLRFQQFKMNQAMNFFNY